MNARRFLCAAFLFTAGLGSGWLVFRSNGDAPHAAVATTAGAPSRLPPRPASEPASAPSTQQPPHAASADPVAPRGTVQTGPAGTVATSGGPVPLSPFHATLLQPTPPQEKEGELTPHQALERQGRDTTWSWQAESDLRGYLAAATSASGIQVLHVECRDTLCEVQALSDDPADSPRWRDLLDAVSRQSWWYEFNGTTAASDEPHDGKRVFTAYLTRKRPR